MSIPNDVHRRNKRATVKAKTGPAPSRLIQDLDVMANPRFGGVDLVGGNSYFKLGLIGAVTLHEI